MGVRASLLFSLLICSIIPAVYCEEVLQEKVSRPVETEAQKSVGSEKADKPDPYANVTWDAVTGSGKGQNQAVTVYTRETADADFVSVSTSGNSGNVANDVAVVVPVGKKSKKWFFW
jgi:hypothetical protein